MGMNGNLEASGPEAVVNDGEELSLSCLMWIWDFNAKVGYLLI